MTSQASDPVRRTSCATDQLGTGMPGVATSAPAPTGDSGGKLLPCPFCGGEADLSKGQKGDGSPWHYVECIKCASMAEPDVWNTRQPPQPTGDVGELVERLRTCARGFDYPDGQLTPTGQTIADAANLIVTLNSRLEQHVEHRDRQLRQMTEAFETSEQALRTAREALSDILEAAKHMPIHMDIMARARVALTGAGEEGE